MCGWISVNNKLPTKNEKVVVSDGEHTWDCGAFQGLAYSDGDKTQWNWKKHTIKTVLWWMPKKDALLPTPNHINIEDTDFIELIKALRCCDEETPAPCICMECPRRNYNGKSYYEDVVSLQDCERALMHEAADAIEELLATKEHYKEGCHFEQALTNVAPVVHGEWARMGDGKDVPYMCSHCGKTSPCNLIERGWYHRYCPACGKKMEV